MYSSITFKELFNIYFKIGIQSIGGGYTMLTVLEDLMVQKKQWITHDEFLHAVTVGQSAPGVMICNVGGFIAYRLRGLPGLLLAMFAMIFPSFLVVILFAVFYSNAQEQIWLRNFFLGIGPAVVGALSALIFRMAYRNRKSGIYLLISLAAFLGVILLHIPPLAIVLIAVIMGIILSYANPKLKFLKSKE